MRSLALILLSVLVLGCAVALGPGFSHSFRSADVSATSIEPVHIHVQVTDKLENVGDRGLAYLDVTLPGGPSFGTRDVSVAVGGKAVTSRRVTRQSGPSLRVPFDPQWLQGQEKEIAFAYDLEPAPEGRELWPPLQMVFIWPIRMFFRNGSRHRAHSRGLPLERTRNNLRSPYPRTSESWQWGASSAASSEETLSFTASKCSERSFRPT